MIRKRLHAALCIVLAPLLAAQQTAGTAATPLGGKPASAPQSVTLARGQEVYLVLLEDISSATAIKGQRVRMAVAEDVIVDGKIVIPKGEMVEGKVSHLTKAISGKRNGYVRVRPLDLTLNGGVQLKLSDYPPGEDDCGDFGPCWAMWTFFAPAAPFALIRMAVDAHRLKEPGVDAIEHICSCHVGYTVQKIKLRVQDTTNMNSSADIANCARSAKSQPSR
ncbi:MAG TPA: hypothetical protein VHD85_19985 [Terracidiphilus sp.]|nr:hypothetical protein [Terracidiphilus sp.]